MAFQLSIRQSAEPLHSVATSGSTQILLRSKIALTSVRSIGTNDSTQRGRCSSAAFLPHISNGRRHFRLTRQCPIFAAKILLSRDQYFRGYHTASQSAYDRAHGSTRHRMKQQVLQLRSPTSRITTLSCACLEQPQCRRLPVRNSIREYPVDSISAQKRGPIPAIPLPCKDRALVNAPDAAICDGLTLPPSESTPDRGICFCHSYAT